MANNVFEQIKKVDEFGSEYWSARDLYKILGYTEYGKFVPAIERAKRACKNSGQIVDLHFAQVSEPQESRNQYGRIQGQMLEDYSLSRYACYLIAQNGDPRKEQIALAQTYFAIQTHKQEMQEQLMEDSKRVLLRDEMKEHNKNLATAANLFRATQTQAKLKRENIQGEGKANQAHYAVGRKVRQTIQELGGTMPEKLPTPEHIRESKKRLKKTSKVELEESK